MSSEGSYHSPSLTAHFLSVCCEVHMKADENTQNLSAIPPRYSYHHKLIPLLLTCVTDEVPEIKQKSHDLWEKVSTSQIALYPGLLIPAFVACIAVLSLSLWLCLCSTASDKCWGEKAGGGGGGGGGGWFSKTHYDCISVLSLWLRLHKHGPQRLDTSMGMHVWKCIMWCHVMLIHLDYR